MGKVDDWEVRLAAAIAKHQALPSAFGTSDCYLIADDAVEAVTGERMYPEALGYTTEAGAAKKLRQHGFETVKDAFAARFPEIPPVMARRGDIGIIDRNGVLSGGVFTSIGFMARGTDGVVFLPISEVSFAYQVG